MTAMLEATLGKLLLLGRVFVDVIVVYITNTWPVILLSALWTRTGGTGGVISALVHVKLGGMLPFCLRDFLLRSPVYFQGKNLFLCRFQHAVSLSFLSLWGGGWWGAWIFWPFPPLQASDSMIPFCHQGLFSAAVFQRGVGPRRDAIFLFSIYTADFVLLVLASVVSLTQEEWCCCLEELTPYGWP